MIPRHSSLPLEIFLSHRSLLRPFAILLGGTLSGCASSPEGLHLTPAGDGPLVIVDWDAKPLPEVPFPTDLATRPDPNSVTGLRVNISEEASTEVERRARRKINELVGFGIFAPITMSFDALLDLDNIVQRHPDDGDHSDDAFFVVDVTPDSPTFLQAVDLDVGHGRFPQDVANPGAYFPNDPHASNPSIMFDTTDEDVNGNGVLDAGEDIDNDGDLDIPNVYPVGGDPREDLLTWYERVSNTLIVRPVVPLREETTYAVVLSNRLTDAEENPIRSPWDWVNHTRQTDTLRPLEDFLPTVGLSTEDIAFTWSFTTGRVTGDLVDIRRSLDGEGPWAFLPEEHPPGISAAELMHESPTLGDPYMLPLTTLVGIIGATGLVDEDALGILTEGYAFGEGMVGGQFLSPNLLADRDDGGGDQVDEWWQVDPVAGTVHAESENITFTCAIPKETEEHKAPFPVAIYGHGYGSNRLEGFLFAWGFLRAGVATCSMDFPGHGAGLDPEQREEVQGILEPLGLLPVLDHLERARFTDTNNDGTPDSGSHQWTADAFHTRDQVRQAVVDWMWMVRALQMCGTGTMELAGQQVTSCDWNQDGTPDIGGPDVDYMAAGGSLGGIIDGVAAAVMPEISSHTPIVAGGGLMDISTRAPTGGAVEAMHGKLMSPFILGRPQEDGGLKITQYVNNFMDMNELDIATISSIPSGGTVVVTNLDNGEVRHGTIPEDGRFRISIPADALDYYEKRVATGMPDTGPEPDTLYTVENNEGLGDRLQIEIFDANHEPVANLNHFEMDGRHEGVTYPAGSPLVAAASGLGKIRAASGTRRLMMMVAMAVEPGDPISYAPHYYLEPFETLGGEPTNVLLMPTPGDMVVSINSEISLARAAGFIDRKEIDPRYGMTQDQWLIDTQVVRGLEEFGPWVNSEGNPVLFDPDDLDDGANPYGEPSDEPLRATVETSAGVSGMRIPYVNPRGSHGFSTPNPSLAFDMNLFALNQLSRYIQTRGTELSDDPCMATDDCDWIPAQGEGQ